MSIKPIDHSVMIPKTQEVANNKQTENLKNKNIVESQFIQQEKTNKINSKKVLNAEKTIYNNIKDEGKSKKKKESRQSNKKEKENKDQTLISEKKPKSINKGHSIDIRI